MNELRHVGWGNEACSLYTVFFTRQVMSDISCRVTKRLENVREDGRSIVVTDDVILNVMDSVYTNRSGGATNIHSRFILKQNPIEDLVCQAVNAIVDTVSAETIQEATNSKLTKWTTLYGEHNAHGLRSHSGIKLNNNSFHGASDHMNY